MEIQPIGGIIGAACLGFAAIGAFLLVPDRELTVREAGYTHNILGFCYLRRVDNL